MELRPLGSTGLRVSPIGLGTVKLGRNTGVKYPGGDGFALPNDQQATALLRAADLGINLIDTAPAYGLSEERLGALLSAGNWFGGRDRWVVCTKAGEDFDPATAQSHFDFSPAAIRTSIERSLTRLRLHHLDVVLLHSDGRDEWIIRDSGALEALAHLKQRGLIRAIGMSAKSPAGGQCALDHNSDALMLTYNAADTASAPAIAAAHAHPAGPRAVLIKKALSSGHASDTRQALRFALAPPGVSSVIVGTLNPAHLRQNVQAITDESGG